MKIKSNKIIGLIFLLLIGLSALSLTAPETRLMRFPDIHGDKVVFVYAGDLWVVSSNGGMAKKITSHPGMEIFPKFSPEGESIAFTAEYDGNNDIFVIPSQGGEPARLTYHPDNDRIVDWYPDGKNLLFLSERESYSYRFNKLFQLSAHGGYPQSLPLPKGGLASFSPDGTKIAYNRMEREFRTWKRYVGGMAQDIWIYDLKNNTIEKITDYEGTDAFPMWHKDSIYFLSDRDHTLNIFCYDLNTKKTHKVTDFAEYDVKWPSLGPNAIVFENGGYLYVLDLTNEQYRKITVHVPSDLLLIRKEYKKVNNLIRHFAISPTGKRALFEARGDIFTVPAEKGDVRNITNTPAIYDRYPTWSPDGKWIAYFSHKTGEYELYIKSQDGKGEEIQVTKEGKSYRFYPRWSPDSKKLLFYDSTFSLYYADIESKQITKIDESDIRGISDYKWSADSKWVVYSRMNESNFSSIHLYSLDQKKSYKITSDFTDDFLPVFDPEGKYLYFLSNRIFNPIFNTFEHNISYNEATTICLATLQADLPSPFEPESDEEVIKEEEKEKEETEKKGKEGEKEKKKEEKVKPLKIDIDGIENRIVSIPVKAGNYYGLVAAKGKIFYMSYPTRPISFGPFDNSSVALHMFDVKERKDHVVLSGIDSYGLSADEKKIIYMDKNNYGIIDAKPKQKKEKPIMTAGMEMQVNPITEWKQMFLEAWRLERDFFYDPNMHGLDWEKIKKKYGELLPYVAHRYDLNYLIGEMIGELNCSHAYVGGGDLPRIKGVSVGLLGADLEPDKESGYYTFKKIYKGHNWDKSLRSPLTEPGINVKQGDYLIAINGQTVRYPDNPYKYLQNLAEKLVDVKVNSKPEEKDAREITIKTIGNEQNIRYRDWVDSNREKVARATNGRVGYLHVPDTSLRGLNEFMRGFYPQVRKEGLIVDVRYNSGGMIPYLFIERLRREVGSLFSNRNTKGLVAPSTAFHGHMVCIINAYAGSGGDIFPNYFRRYSLGPIIGKRTWGGLVGISGGISLMDGGYVTMPSTGMWSLNGKYDVENYGVDPDIEIDNRPDLVVKGHDPQLEKAIENVIQKIKEEPKTLPKKPKYPIRN